MLEILKSLFFRKKKTEYIPDPPGRTFKRVLTGRYFGCEDVNADESSIEQAKQSKIDKITELGLVPMFVRYSYENTSSDLKITSAHVVFQKEEKAENWNMVHVTEISFIVNHSDFEEFEKMAGVNLDNDFRDLTSYNDSSYNGPEKRKEKREI
ncbi:MAG: hypothetical protein P794_00900 [Epsilonproteobacteria bacterium (ex Lamellibrachia satsuma)]|nr:MAG: hypothetical protein P794_00900 [Epsilonproteobacteria bacterium (ex Lamellibrachia satsuma)]